eukprot:s2668_g2.t1
MDFLLPARLTVLSSPAVGAGPRTLAPARSAGRPAGHRGAVGAWAATAASVLGFMHRNLRRSGCQAGPNGRRSWLQMVMLGGCAAPVEAKGNPFVLLQDGMNAFRDYRVEDSIKLFDEAADSGYPKARLWQRGLSLYYAERFEDGTQQFRKDVEMNPNDTEESVWAFLCEAQTVGFEQARKQLMKVGFDPRPVMGSVYALYRGDDDAKHIDTLEGLYKKGGSDAFYASLYLGLYYEAKSDKDNAKLWLLRSVDSNYGKSSNDYMTDLARVHVSRRQWRNAEL